MPNLKYTKELLGPIVKKSLSWAQVCRALGKKPMTGSQAHIKKRAEQFGINFSHFTGQGWRKGRTFPYRRPIEDFLVKNKSVSSDRLKKRLFREGLKKKECEKCHLATWFNEELPLELDHKNEDILDNRLENLQILCPNCHSIKTRKDRKNKKGRLAQLEEATILEIV